MMIPRFHTEPQIVIFSMTEKICSICGKPNESEWFRTCDACRARSRGYHLKNREKELEQTRRYIQEHPEKRRQTIRSYYLSHKGELQRKSHEYTDRSRFTVLKHYSTWPYPRCDCCGENEILFLELHHLNGGGRKHRDKLWEEGISFNLWLIKNKFPEGYRVLCANCHAAITKIGECPHQESCDW